MKTKLNLEITKQAMNSKCTVCGEKITCFQLWKYNQVGKTLLFAHDKCLFPNYYKKIDEKLKKR